MAAYIQDVVRGLARPKELAYVLQQDIPLVQIERYFLQAPALGHDRSRAPAALGGGGQDHQFQAVGEARQHVKDYPDSGRPWTCHTGIERSVELKFARGTCRRSVCYHREFPK